LQLLRNERYKLPETETGAEIGNGEKDNYGLYSDHFTNHQSMPDLAKITLNNQGTNL